MFCLPHFWAKIHGVNDIHFQKLYLFSLKNFIQETQIRKKDVKDIIITDIIQIQKWKPACKKQ